MKMEQSFADLLSDAFSGTAVPSFPDEDLDFENLNLDETSEAIKTDISQENAVTKEDGALQQEATGQTALLSNMETKNIYMAENVDEEQCDDKSEEDFEGVGVMNRDKTLEDYTSSEEETEEKGSGEDEEEEEDEEDDIGPGEEPGDLLRSVRCDDDFCDGNKEDRIFTEGQPLAPEAAGNPQVRNEEQGESESDEEMSYFERVPERGSEMMVRGDGIEEDEREKEKEKEEDSRDSECEGREIEQEEAVLALCCEQKLEDPCGDGPAKANLEFPEISVKNLPDLIAEVDSEKYGEKMKDFSGEEHQDAGESFADYPSDFSSCEYVEDGGKNQEKDYQSKASACASDSDSITKQNTCLEGAVTDVMRMGRAEDTGEEGDGYLYSRNLEVDANEFRSLDVANGEKDFVEKVSGDAAVTGVDDGGETGESDSYTSSDDEFQEKRSDVELMCPQDAASSDYYNRVDPADFHIHWNLDVLTADTRLSEDLLTAEDTDEVDALLSDVTQHPAEDGNSYSVVQSAKTTNPSNQGSLDDSFFFNTEPEASGIMETGQLGDDEDEEERDWEKEQQRIKAFYEFYDDSDGENESEGRQIKVQFCADPLSQVIHYETDSDRASLSSSTDGEEDLSSAETSEELKELNNATEMSQACDPPNTQLPENVPDISDTHICTKKHKCFNMLKLTLKMGLVILTGLLMFWFATDQAGWFSDVSFF
ncbi:midasin isoform X2 [Anarrhichthys ocellatus]|uniref:midasin isoform X2 n=1 Tax=Anarrhichthys ocellatus TaxID=433405 RepID=UPI0012ED8453|nr:midasin-like isoform X2 [Anarrhichthys ocellatus]